MLRPVARGVQVHESEFLQSNAVVVEGPAGVLVIDPGIRRSEMTCLAKDLSGAGQIVSAGFSTHPHWDHVLWHPEFGDVPRYATAGGASAMRDLLADPGWPARVRNVLPSDIAEEIPLELLGLITGLPAETTALEWDGPPVRIIEHRAHVAGHAAVLIEEPGVLVAGDMLSDILIPFLDLRAADPIEDYLAALAMLEAVSDDVDVVVPGHGSVGGSEELGRRIALDRAYVGALREGRDPHDPRMDRSPIGREVLAAVHERQVQRLAQPRDDRESPG